MTLFILFGLLVVGAAIYFGNRQPGEPRTGRRQDDDGYSFNETSRSIFEDSGNAGCGDGDRDGDGIPDSIDTDDGGGSCDSSDGGGDSGGGSSD